MDYKNTVFLPRTEFTMKGRLSTREPEILQYWKELDLYRRLREQGGGREKFILHDGPPYANGHIHIGHAVNKILKDVINRGWQMFGYDAVYVPGWDCHGLPIEWKIEEEYREKKIDKNTIPIDRFRGECRRFAERWIGIQREEFQALGVIGDWRTPYTTMSYQAEATIVEEIHRFIRSGELYRGVKPVLWSVVEKTALADAEIEYKDHTSNAIYVKFPIQEPRELREACVVIWTTTPWTIPGNRAIAYNRRRQYGVYRVDGVQTEGFCRIGERLVVESSRMEAVAEEAGITAWSRLESLSETTLEALSCRHPLYGQGYEFSVGLYSADFVTTEVGSGLVHIAPGHGDDDYRLGLVNGLEMPETVDENGVYYPDVPLFGGRQIYTSRGQTGDADNAVIQALRERGMLLGQNTLTHSYPHSWRSKAPLIFRATPQWFISMERGRLREKALAGIDQTRWIPQESRNRLESMIQTRPDWCISRQRSWGVPLAFFVKKGSDEILADSEVLSRIVEIIRQEGTDAWFTRDPQEFLGNEYRSQEFEQIRDIVDVWFESGSTHSFVLEQRPELEWPASLYLEGSDQHRGWFHSSLLEACATRSCPPYRAVLTHGFVLDEQNRKMSKSLNNALSPQEITRRYGADILRLWVIGSNYFSDLRIGPEILKHQVDLYRRLRNTLRYLLGSLADYSLEERLPLDSLPQFESWVLHRMAEIDDVVRQAVQSCDFHAMLTELYTFCIQDLSAFYFDVRKDVLYCDLPTSTRRRAVRTVLEQVFLNLSAWLAPILCFTAEDAWSHRPEAFKEKEESVHLRRFPLIPPQWRQPFLGERWKQIRSIRRVVTTALEQARAAKLIGSSLQAAVTLSVPSETLRRLLETIDFKDIIITSQLSIVVARVPLEQAFILEERPDIGVTIALAQGDKCERCWKILPEVGANALCQRCEQATLNPVSL